MIYSLLYWPCFVLFHLLVRIRTRGAGHMPREGGVLLVCNHLSLMDPPLIAITFRRHLYFMGKSELMTPAWKGWVVHQVNGFGVRRGEPDRAGLRLAEDHLARGHGVVIFPEGHRSPTATLQHPHEGVAFLARRARVPVLPVGIAGTERFTPRALWRRPLVRITVGEPFRLDHLGPGERRQGAEIMMRRIAALLPPAYRGAYGEDLAAPGERT